MTERREESRRKKEERREVKGKKPDGEILNPLTEEDLCGGGKRGEREREERSRLGIALSAEAHLLYFTVTANTVGDYIC